LSEHSAQHHALVGSAFIVVGAIAIQTSAAVIMPVFSAIGPSAASAWRFVLGAMFLLGATRPALRTWTRHQWRATIALGVSTAFMNQCFYQSIARIPLGAAVAVEYLGPFFVAALGKRSWRHLGFVAVAGAGVLALARPGGGVTVVGILFAAGSGLGWAAYAFSSHRVGGATPGFGGLAVAMSISALVTLPFALGSLGRVVGDPVLLGRVAVTALLAIVIGFGAEMQALRRVRPSIVSVLLALDPAVAFAAGFVLLHQHVSPWDLVGLACVIGAGVGVTTDVDEGDLGVPR
jgi:inner membrane transporter RhtA